MFDTYLASSFAYLSYWLFFFVSVYNVNTKQVFSQRCFITTFTLETEANRIHCSPLHQLAISYYTCPFLHIIPPTHCSRIKPTSVLPRMLLRQNPLPLLSYLFLHPLPPPLLLGTMLCTELNVSRALHGSQTYPNKAPALQLVFIFAQQHTRCTMSWPLPLLHYHS